MITVKKPLSILREDFITMLVELCNNSEMPYFIVEGILRDVLNEVHVASQKQLEADRKRYEEELRKLSSLEETGDEDVSF